jgi:hypothetical protein
LAEADLQTSAARLSTMSVDGAESGSYWQRTVGWLEPARKIADVKQTLQTSWREESAHLNTVGMEPSAVEVGETEDWATIAYQIANKHGSSVHIRASRIVADTWIDLHLSVTSEATAADNRVLVAQILKSMTIRVK